jgi:hypothetical protein
MEYRRFGRTEYQMPVISCGGMRYQESWKSGDPVSDENQKNLEACIHRAVELGINHIETARGYGTSEYQLGKVLPTIPREKLLVQTKVGPSKDLDKFKATVEKSMALMNMDYLDIFSFHGINSDENLEWALNAMDTINQWKKEGRIRDVGFSTHGPTDIIVKTLKTGLFDHVNLHYYYIWQDNWAAIEEATRQDSGVFIISPNDKGGMLYKPSDRLCELTAPYHPMIFNDLFCLSHPEIHTLSCGASRPEDFDIHNEAVDLLPKAGEILPPILARLKEAMVEKLGEDWVENWDEGLPIWSETPGEINLHWILRLRNLAIAFEMTGYGKMRYNMLGNAGPWCPGQNASTANAQDWEACLSESPFGEQIPDYLNEADEMLKGDKQKRLQE